MRMTKHAIARSKQRGIPRDLIEMILEYGTPSIRPGDAVEYKVYKKDTARLISQLKYLIHSLEKATCKAVLVHPEAGDVITVYNLVH